MHQVLQMHDNVILFFFCLLIVIYLLSRDNLKASAVLITSTYAWSSKRRDVTFKLWFNIANLNADCTSSVPCSNIAPEIKNQNSLLIAVQKSKTTPNGLNWFKKMKIWTKWIENRPFLLFIIYSVLLPLWLFWM